MKKRRCFRVGAFLGSVICYPTRLLALVRRWLAADTVGNFVCTLKFQGETDHGTAAAFAAIPGSRLFHAHHNKHELTWVRLGRDAGPGYGPSAGRGS